MVLAHRLPEPAPDPLVEWVTAAQAGDDSAFAELVQRHDRAIYSFTLGLVRNTDDARDLVQEVWVRVARHLPQLREPARFTPWLYRIARNCCMDFLQSRKTRMYATLPPTDGDDDEPRFDPPDLNAEAPDQHVVSLDERRKVWEALGGLSERDRTALFLREFEELPYAEIGRVLGISPNAAEVRVFRARERFRRQFSRVEAAEPDCNVSPLQLSALVDGELSRAARIMLDRHVADCADCTARLGQMHTGRRMYGGLDDAGTPPVDEPASPALPLALRRPARRVASDPEVATGSAPPR
jgi:RNA polymerase sigma-70 factor (ECF subfamily)